MSDETTYQGSEAVEPENPFEKRKMRFNYVCSRCDRAFSKIAYAIPKKEPKCPNPACVEVAENRDLKLRVANLERMLQDGRGPAHIGANTTVKAVDFTAEVVMKDFNLTDLKDNIREGEGVAPKLPPAQQAAADNFFVGAPATLRAPQTGPTGFRDAKMPDFGTGQVRTVKARQMEMLGRRAIGGAFRGMAVGPTAVVPTAQRGQSPIIRVRQEDNPGYTGQRNNR